MIIRTFAILLLTFFLCMSVRSQKLEVFHSLHLPKNDSVWVFVPSSAQELNKYPLLFLLHGWSGNYKTWHQMVDCQHLADSFGFIIACPDGLYDSWYMDHPLRKELQYSTFFGEELVPYLAYHYPVDKRYIFISGLSMGGFGSLYLAARHPGFFWAAASMSGVFDLSREVLVKRGLPDVEGSREFWKEYSLFSFLQNHCLPALPVYLDCGDKDPYFHDSVLLLMLSKQCELDYHLEIFPGKHDRDFWNAAVYRHIDFFLETLPGYRKGIE